MNQPRGRGTRINEAKNQWTIKAANTPVSKATHRRTPSQAHKAATTRVAVGKKPSRSATRR